MIFGLVIVLSAWIGVEIAARLLKRLRVPTEHAWRAMVWVVLFALVGARLWFILFPPQSVVAGGRTTAWFLANFLEVNQGAIAIWSGGLGVLGALIGTLTAVFLYSAKHTLHRDQMLAAAVISLSAAQTVGRWIGVLAPHHDPMWWAESILCAAIFGILLGQFLLFTPNTSGNESSAYWRIVLLYGLFYGIGRAIIEFWRTNVPLIGSVNVNQAVCVLLGVACAVLLRRVQMPNQS
ncbi:MAG: prolipoprotein diacylglyceryl transferase [Anaerolineae bacterium]